MPAPLRRTTWLLNGVCVMASVVVAGCAMILATAVAVVVDVEACC